MGEKRRVDVIFFFIFLCSQSHDQRQKAFGQRKAVILQNLSVGNDKSPKGFVSFHISFLCHISSLTEHMAGSVDEPIEGLVKLLNDSDKYITTSSCSGRICLFKSHSVSFSYQSYETSSSHEQSHEISFLHHNQISSESSPPTLNPSPSSLSQCPPSPPHHGNSDPHPVSTCSTPKSKGGGWLLSEHRQVTFDEVITALRHSVTQDYSLLFFKVSCVELL
jgi:hypothetical protein